MALQRVLADPEFVFRKETEPENVRAGQKYRISDLELASRLSFFLWSSIPDDELITVAGQNKLHETATLEKQVRRMLADPKSDALVNNFAGQWLNVRSLQTIEPLATNYPDFDDNLRAAMRKEMDLFVGSIVHENRSVIDLLNANYTFLNERLAKHYGMANIYGSNFRRVELTPEFDMRRGLLGKGAIETITGYAAAARPTVRGKMIMQMFLGIEPPSPPPNVQNRPAGIGNDEHAAVPADDAPEDGDASQERTLRELPQDHGSDRSLARELRRDRAMAHYRRRAAPSMPPASWWMALLSTAWPACVMPW